MMTPARPDRPSKDASASSSGTALEALSRLACRIVASAFPCDCLGCGSALPFPTPALSLCDLCRARLEAAWSPLACQRCGARLEAALDRYDRECGRCLGGGPPWERLVWGSLYRPPLDGVVRALKYHRQAFLAADLARLVARRWRRSATRDVDVVTAVPLPTLRRLRRGYDQAELIARRLARELDLPYRRLLARGWRPPQTRRGRRRRQVNLWHAFRTTTGMSPGTRVLLVDDVITTGATLSEATRALQRGGLTRVVAAVAARTPRRREGWTARDDAPIDFACADG